MAIETGAIKGTLIPEPKKGFVIRDYSEPLFRGLSHMVIAVTPKDEEGKTKLKAEYITYSGVALVLAGLALSEYENLHPSKHYLRNKIIAGTLIIGGYLCDAWDGPHARETKTDGINGAITDTKWDKRQEYAGKFEVAVSMALKGDKTGAMLALMNGMSDPMPSVEITNDQRKGIDMKEREKHPLAFLGTRLPRAVMNTAGSLAPEYKGIPIQKILLAFSFFGNSLSIYERLHPEKYGEKMPEDDKKTLVKIKTAQDKFPVVLRTVREGMGLGGALGLAIAILPKIDVTRKPKAS